MQEKIKVLKLQYKSPDKLNETAASSNFNDDYAHHLICTPVDLQKTEEDNKVLSIIEEMMQANQAALQYLKSFENKKCDSLKIESLIQALHNLQPSQQY